MANEHSDYRRKPGAYFEDSRPEMSKFVPPIIKKVLDVGCGRGGFSTALRKLHPSLETWGLEMMPEVAAFAKDNLDRVLTGTFEHCQAELPKQFFDLVVFNDVLEHMEDPLSVLRSTREFLSPGGVILASIPNIRYIGVMKSLVWEGSWTYTDWGVLDRTHLRFFTRSSILQTFAECGYEVDCIEGINPTPLGAPLSIVNSFLGGRFADMRFQQFAVRTHPV